MLVDFKEIPMANKGDGHQDEFEFFAKDFLLESGFVIIQGPDRGPDGKKDLIVAENIDRHGTNVTIKYLVSCKHTAHSGASVNEKDEINILERARRHNCKGFIAFYSMLPSSGLSSCLSGLESDIHVRTFERTAIERGLLSDRMDTVFLRYFPKSYESYKALFGTEKHSKNKVEPWNEELIFRTVLSAQVISEILKIREEYYDTEEKEKKSSILGKLYRYHNHNTDRISDEVFDFLYDIAQNTRAGMQASSAIEIFSLVSTFYNSIEQDEGKSKNRIKQAAMIGFSIAYDAFIYLKNYYVAAFGLLIIKFAYRQSGIIKNDSYKAFALGRYEELSEQLNRPDRPELKEAIRFVEVFKNDKDNYSISIPVMPNDLRKLFEEGEKR